MSATRTQLLKWPSSISVREKSFLSRRAQLVITWASWWILIRVELNPCRDKRTEGGCGLRYESSTTAD